MECWRLWKWFGRLVERVLELAAMVLERLLDLAVMVLERLLELEYLHR